MVLHAGWLLATTITRAWPLSVRLAALGSTFRAPWREIIHTDSRSPATPRNSRVSSRDNHAAIAVQTVTLGLKGFKRGSPGSHSNDDAGSDCGVRDLGARAHGSGGMTASVPVRCLDHLSCATGAAAAAAAPQQACAWCPTEAVKSQKKSIIEGPPSTRTNILDTLYVQQGRTTGCCVLCEQQPTPQSTGPAGHSLAASSATPHGPPACRCSMQRRRSCTAPGPHRAERPAQSASRAYFIETRRDRRRARTDHRTAQTSASWVAAPLI